MSFPVNTKQLTTRYLCPKCNQSITVTSTNTITVYGPRNSRCCGCGLNIHKSNATSTFPPATPAPPNTTFLFLPESLADKFGFSLYLLPKLQMQFAKTETQLVNGEIYLIGQLHILQSQKLGLSLYQGRATILEIDGLFLKRCGINWKPEICEKLYFSLKREGQS